MSHYVRPVPQRGSLLLSPFRQLQIKGKGKGKHNQKDGGKGGDKRPARKPRELAVLSPWVSGLVVCGSG